MLPLAHDALALNLVFDVLALALALGLAPDTLSFDLRNEEL
jgi:hypothetical protein